MGPESLYPTTTTPQLDHSIKIAYGNELRRFVFQGNSFKELQFRVRSILGLTPDQGLHFKYQDEDQDWITLSSDKELIAAFELFGNSVLRLKVESVNDTPTIPEVVSPPTTGDSCQNIFHPLKGVSHETFKVESHFPIKKKCFKERKALKNAFLGCRFVQDVTIPKFERMLPETHFTKTWKLRNESEIQWPNIFLFFKKGNKFGTSEEWIQIPPVNPGQEFDVSIDLVAPKEHGKHVGVWKLCGPWGKPFGDPLKVVIIVSSSEVEPLDPVTSDMVEKLFAMGFHNRKRNAKLLLKHEGDLNKVVGKLLKV